MELTTTTTVAEFERIFHEILRPAFNDDELVPLESFLRRIENNSLDITIARDNGEPIGVAIGDLLPASNAVLLSYLAVRTNARASGIGSIVFGAAMDNWAQRYQPSLIVAEVEHPRFFTGDLHRGDPKRRIRFYEKMGGEILDIPYFQPPVAAGRPFVFGMVLMAFRVREEELRPIGEGLGIHSVLVRRILEDYGDEFFVPTPSSEHAVSDIATALENELIALVPVERIDEVRFPSLERQFNPR